MKENTKYLNKLREECDFLISEAKRGDYDKQELESLLDIEIIIANKIRESKKYNDDSNSSLYKEIEEVLYPEDRFNSPLRNVLFTSQKAVLEVLSFMNNTISKYGIVYVRDLYDRYDFLSDKCLKKGVDYVWTNVSNYSIVPCGPGYKLRLPRAVPLYR